MASKNQRESKESPLSSLQVRLLENAGARDPSLKGNFTPEYSAALMAREVMEAGGVYFPKE
jgi:hypothetical protein